MKQFSFRRPYKRVTDEDYGSVLEAIVLYEKRAFTFNSVVLKDEEAQKKGYRIETRPVEWKNYLRVDLWLVILQWSWVSKEKTDD